MNQTENATLDPYFRSMQLLHNTVTGSDSLQWDDGEYGKVEIFVRGMSRRWYKINAHQLTPDVIGEKKKPHWTCSWVINVRGAAWRSDFNNNKSLVVSLCIHTNKTGARLPIGDSLVSLCLSLVNDKTTALNIPLLAQFIVCPRKRLSTIEIFQDEGVITSDMLEGGEDIFGDWDEDWEEEEEDLSWHHDMGLIDESPNPSEILAELFLQQNTLTAAEERREIENELQEENRINDIEKMIYDHERAADRAADRR